MAERNVVINNVFYNLKTLMKLIKDVKKLCTKSLEGSELTVPGSEFAEIMNNVRNKYLEVQEAAGMDSGSWYTFNRLRRAIKNGTTNRFHKFVLSMDEAKFICETIVKFNDLFVYMKETAEPFLIQIKDEEAKLSDLSTNNESLPTMKFHELVARPNMNEIFINFLAEKSEYWCDIYHMIDFLDETIRVTEDNTQWVLAFSITGPSINSIETMCVRTKPNELALLRVVESIFNEYKMTVAVNPEVEVISQTEDSTVYKLKVISLEGESNDVADDEYSVIYTATLTKIPEVL